MQLGDNALPTEGTALDATGHRQLTSMRCKRGAQPKPI
jgi:hypothetical protein